MQSYNRVVSLTVVSLVVAASLAYVVSGPTQALDKDELEAHVRIDVLEERVALLEARISQLEEMSQSTSGTNAGTAADAASGRVMMVEYVGKPDMPADLDREIFEKNRQADEKEKLAAAAKDEADRNISRGGNSRSPWQRDKDAEKDAIRKAKLEEQARLLAEARRLRGEAMRLRNEFDARTLIRGWNGERTVELELRSSLPASCRDLTSGDFITWSGRVQSSSLDFEAWDCTRIDRATAPADFKKRRIGQ